MKVRFQGHVDSTAPDHLGAILQVLATQACTGCDLASAKVQPTAIAGQATPLMRRWSPLLGPLYGKIDDPLAASDAIVQAVQAGVAACSGNETGKACGIVGCLMAIRDIEVMEDEDL